VATMIIHGRLEQSWNASTGMLKLSHPRLKVITRMH